MRAHESYDFEIDGVQHVACVKTVYVAVSTRADSDTSWTELHVIGTQAGNVVARVRQRERHGTRGRTVRGWPHWYVFAGLADALRWAETCCDVLPPVLAERAVADLERWIDAREV